jgi:hypothetical protein
LFAHPDAVRDGHDEIVSVYRHPELPGHAREERVIAGLDLRVSRPLLPRAPSAPRSVGTLTQFEEVLDDRFVRR